MIEQIATPYLRIDTAVVQRNINRLADYAARHGMGVRPHTKTHKSKRFAQMQLDAGAIGLTVAKIGEAQVMAELGCELLLAYPIIDPPRLKSVADLAGRCDLIVPVDSADGVELLSQAVSAAGHTIGVLVDMDVGMGRTGVQTPDQSLALAQQVDRAAGLQLRGLFTYNGHINDATDQQSAALNPIADKTQQALDLWQQHGLNTAIVSGGSTPTAYQSHLTPQLTEIRPGNYIFNDMNQIHGRFCTYADCAATIVATVVSNAVPGQVVLDAGSKTLTMDRCALAPDSGHGHIIEYPQAKIDHLTEEHGEVDVTACDTPPRLGEQVTVIPNHLCPCVNLHDRMWLSNGTAPLQPTAVDARGMVV